MALSIRSFEKMALSIRSFERMALSIRSFERMALSIRSFEKMALYKAAGFIFYWYKYIPPLKRTYLQVYLQYEVKHSQWSHFGGKREPYEMDSFSTASENFKKSTIGLYHF
jgi:hypothetical protein